MKPIVGIVGYYLTRGENHLLNFDINIAPKPVTDAFKNAGTVPFILPLSEPEDAASYIKRIDALVLTGGADVNPMLFDEEPQPKIGIIEPDRDAFELALIREAWTQKKPIFGICRGLQLLNVAFGGSLYQDLAYYSDLAVNHTQPTPWKTPTHSIKIAEDSWLGASLGTEQVINSYHHQAVKDLADVFRPVAWSKDGLIEGFESMERDQKVMAIQWHPEILVEVVPESQKVFDDFAKLIKEDEA
jgi:putative glutamine amidotransferase